MIAAETVETDIPDESIAQIRGDMLVIKENSLARSAMKLSTAEHRFVNVLSAIITPDDKIIQHTIIKRFRIKDYCDFFNLDESGNHTQLKNLFISLRKKTFEVNRNGKTHITGWINWATIIHGAGIVEVSIDERILPFLLYIRNNAQIGIDPNIGYIKHPLTAIKYFSSEYAFNFYSYIKTCIQNKKYVKLHFTIDEMRKIMIVDPKEYTQYTGFRVRVFMPALAEINGDMELLTKFRKKKKNGLENITPTDIHIKFTECKKGRKVEALELEVWKHSNINRVEIVEAADKEARKILKDIGYTEKETDKILRSCGSAATDMEKISANARYAKAEYDRRKNAHNAIKSLVAYTITCIRENVVENENSFEKSKSEASATNLWPEQAVESEVPSEIDLKSAFSKADLSAHLERYAEQNGLSIEEVNKILDGKTMGLESVKLNVYLMRIKNGGERR